MSSYYRLPSELIDIIDQDYLCQTRIVPGINEKKVRITDYILKQLNVNYGFNLPNPDTIHQMSQKDFWHLSKMPIVDYMIDYKRAEIDDWLETNIHHVTESEYFYSITLKTIISICCSPKAMFYMLNHQDNIDNDWFSANPNNIAVKFMIKNPDRIQSSFSDNPNRMAVDYLINNPHKISYNSLSRNRNTTAVNYLIEHDDRIYWPSFKSNPNDLAVDFMLKKPPNKFLDDNLMCNTNPKMVKYMTDNIKTWDSHHKKLFSLNKSDFAVDFLIQNPQFINWEKFKENPNPKAIYYILEHPEKNVSYVERTRQYRDYPRYTDWIWFAKNPNPIVVDYYIKHHSDKIIWSVFSTNPNPLAIRYSIEHCPKKYKANLYTKNSGIFQHDTTVRDLLNSF